MGIRSFRDANDVEWQVWMVRPEASYRTDSLAGHVSPELRNGWLAFRSTTEVRRLVAFDPLWETASDDSLRALLAQAKRSSGGHRLT